MGRLVIVSNRVGVPKRGDAPTAGGLAVALKDAFSNRGGLWFGWSGTVSADPPDVVKHARRGNVDYAVIDLSQEAYEGFYAGHANAALWPVFHFRLGLLSYDRDHAECYRAANRRYAEKLLPLLRPDDTIWVHDYQLIPLGAELRAMGSRHRIGFFHHIPFPPWAVFSAMPGAEEVIRALLAYDLVGVQTHRDLTGLLDCMAQGTGMKVRAGGEIRFRGRRTRFRAFPIAIATDEFAELAARNVTQPATQRLQASLAGRDLIIGAERLDYTKGLPERLRAFGALLERFPEHSSHVTYLQVAARSREDVESYKDLKREIEHLAGRINGDYSDADWTPVRYVGRAVPRDTLAGFYRIAKVGLVTPLRDGMNLVAKEYVAAQDPEDPGVLVLSRFAGAAEGMPEALLVNPLDAYGMAEALNAALTMPLEERRERHAAMFRRLQAHSVSGWAKSFLDALERPDTSDTTHSRAAALSVFQPRLLSRSAATSSDSASEESVVSHVAGWSTARAS
ncbi:alpha,alpha-trehalose-phosphate synthase (UDP-forming) [Roseomonas xinghualingensis]|uniref:alpha,alpha-trehalose-phosphate synthase (UDP-forming) n=1 Tax=Roseomonas xinghualingensis TaxID=2986475 RepID=UPI0021F0EA06|nr:trehalose-6-phosphate synthase [Roseomonas sp. SXEYE001]MCV4207125.1 trehalose-6-phosphate synthase [Roseomonas sp. SXEYE001]